MLQSCVRMFYITGSCKQIVPTTLAIFYPTKLAAIKYYFPEKTDAAEFLILIYTLRTTSNSNTRVSSSHRF